MNFNNKKVLIVGMARSGIAAANLLTALNAEIFLYDSKPLNELPEYVRMNISKLKHTGLFAKDPFSYINELDILVMSPGVPMDQPFIKKAYELDKKVISEIELGFLLTEADFIAVTGTNGKTTTTALTGEIFKNADYNTFVLGNIGVPITQEVLNTKKGDVIVAETAALQLDSIDTYRPKGSAVLNITEDHLNRYGTMENYIATKARIFENQTKEDYCVLNYDNIIVRELKNKINTQLYWFSREKSFDNGIYVENDNIIFSANGKKEIICGVDDVYIPGRHNLENALAAVGLTRLYGVEPDVIAETLKSFKGVEHRIEFVREVNGVEFINDSKGTNPDATINAIHAMKKPAVLILGGYDKNSDFTSLFKEFKNIKAIVLLGETSSKLEKTAIENGFENYVKADSFEEAVIRAYELAEQNQAVLLSPACASWDMFTDFEERGRAFKEIVKGL